ncbi:MAG: hypothetical protein ACOYMH_11015 [Zwartia sp.]|jgi:hypothetical protein
MQSLESSQSVDKGAWRKLGLAFVNIVWSLVVCLGIPAAKATELPAAAKYFFANTYLIDIGQGSQLSQVMRASQTGGFETANGNWVSFKGWYSTNWTDSRLAMMTQLTPWLGLIWGASTGEFGEKYTIDPSVKVGLVVRHDFAKNSSLSFKATTILGGSLREKSCIADYGEIGGQQKVNCRLAATPLAPNDTLQYLYNMKPLNSYFLSLQYSLSF